MPITFTNGRVLTGDVFRTDVSVTVEGDRIIRVGPGHGPDGEVHDLGGAYLVPGFIDTQVNGGGGILFNDCPTADCIDAIGQAHRRFGTTGFLPTLISDDLSVIDTAITAVEEAIARGTPGVLGIHIEGPFLNASRKGVHDASKFRTLDDDAIALLTRLKSGRTLVTLAPETTTPAMITRLAQAGAVVAAGHTDADYATTRAALDAGMTGFTHLFNAMPGLHHRDPGMVGAALAHAEYAEIIPDLLHVHPGAIKTALRCIPKLFCVTDSTAAAGMPDGEYMLGRQVVHKCMGGVRLADGTLAGSTLTMDQALRNLVKIGLPLEEACLRVSTNAADYLGETRRGRLAPGCHADFVVLDRELNIKAVYIEGEAL